MPIDAQVSLVFHSTVPPGLINRLRRERPGMNAGATVFRPSGTMTRIIPTSTAIQLHLDLLNAKLKIKLPDAER